LIPTVQFYPSNYAQIAADVGYTPPSFMCSTG
jgi:hypothetical protein